jgi:hypothetical protein
MVFQNDILAGASGAAAGGYTIDQSIRFNSTDSAYLTRTPTSTGDQKKWTTSFWFKRSSTGVTDYFMTGGQTSTNDGIAAIYIDSSDDTIHTYFDTSGSAPYGSVNSRKFRDPSAWYHLIWAVDAVNTTQRIWVNGEELTLDAAKNPPNYPYDMNASGGGKRMSFGSQAWGFSNYFDGYAAEIHHLDGQYITDPTTFGEYDSNGVWRPIEVTGLTYGTNGFYITGENSSTLGEDFSGNGNDFTSSGLTTSSQVLDTPTDNYCTMCELHQNRDSNITNSDGVRAANLQIFRPSASANSFGSGTMTVYGGAGAPKLYYEVYTTTYPGNNVLQVYIEEATATNLQPNSFGINQRYSTSAYRIFVYPGGSETPGSWTSYFGEGVYVGLAVDFANDEISANVDGTEIFSYNATELAALTGITVDTFAGRWWRPKVQVANDAATVIDVNFGQNAFQNAPTGYVGWSTSAISTPAVADGSDYFKPLLYTGTGNVTRSITGVGFQPDVVLAKHRTNASANVIANAVSGVNTFMATEQTAAESSFTNSIYGYLSSFDSDGFTLTPGSTNNNYWNESSIPIVAYSWLAGNGTASNTDGSITSTVSANTTAGLSVVTYTGTGSLATVGHGLGATPAIIIVKRRDGANSWAVFQDFYGNGAPANNGYLLLNSNAAWSGVSGNNYWNDTSPTSSVFTVKDAGDVNASGDSYLAYCWAEIEGFSKFGSFIGNGSADGPFIQCGFRPAFVTIKEVSAADDWVNYDTARDTYNVSGQVWRFDSNAAEFDGRGGSRDIDILSNGFKIRTSNGTINTSGNTFIFMAFAEHPFGGNGVAPVPAR